MQKHLGNLQVLSRTRPRQECHDTGLDRKIREVSQLRDTREGIHRRITGHVEQGLGANLEVGVIHQAFDLGQDRLVTRFRQNGNGLLPDFRRGMIEKVAHDRMCRPMAGDFKQAQSIEDFLGIRGTKIGCKDFYACAIKHRRRSPLGIQPMLLHAGPQRDHVLSTRHPGSRHPPQDQHHAD